MNVISERFPGFGIVFKAKIALKIEEMSAIPSTGSSLIALLLIWSCPGAFLGLRRWINSLTSREVKGLMGETFGRENAGILLFSEWHRRNEV